MSDKLLWTQSSQGRPRHVRYITVDTKQPESTSSCQIHYCGHKAVRVDLVMSDKLLWAQSSQGLSAIGTLISSSAVRVDLVMSDKLLWTQSSQGRPRHVRQITVGTKQSGSTSSCQINYCGHKAVRVDLVMSDKLLWTQSSQSRPRHIPH